MRNQQLVTYRSPFRGLLDSFFPDSLPEVFPGPRVPATDIAETEDAFLFSFELPGVDEQDIQVNVHERRLTVTAERKDQRQQEGRTWHRAEQHYGQVSRTILLPDAANPEAIEATFKNGILGVHVQKHPKSKPVRIQVKGS